MHKQELIVSVCVISYKHEEFIASCIDGILAQKTSFPFEVLISDDASPDRTHEIIKSYVAKYPTIIRDISKEKNIGSVKNFYTTLLNANGNYIAICEGDDYWSDPLKLQKQIDFLEHNSEYGMTYARAKLYNNSLKKFYKNANGGKINSFKEIFVHGSRVTTLTSCFRKELFLRYIEEVKPLEKNWRLGDLPMWLWFFYNSKVHFSPDIVAVYRKLENSASNSTDFQKQYDFNRSCFEVRAFYKEHYELDLPLEWNEERINFRIAFHIFDRDKLLNCNYEALNKKEKLIWIIAQSPFLFKCIKHLYFIYKGAV